MLPLVSHNTLWKNPASQASIIGLGAATGSATIRDQVDREGFRASRTQDQNTSAGRTAQWLGNRVHAPPSTGSGLLRDRHQFPSQNPSNRLLIQVSDMRLPRTIYVRNANMSSADAQSLRHPLCMHPLFRCDQIPVFRISIKPSKRLLYSFALFTLFGGQIH